MELPPQYPPVVGILLDGILGKLDGERAENQRLRAALEKAEAVMSIVEPRSDKREYLETLLDVREALGLDRKTGRSPVSS